MVFTTAMETMNRFHYCYRDEEWNYNAKYKSYILCFSDYVRHLWNYNENKYHIYCFFRIILNTYGIIMRKKNHIYCAFRIILDTYGIIKKIIIIYFVFFGLF